jgi:hypothetical protein
MAEIHEQLEGEGLVKQAQVTLITGRLNALGRLYLTGRRLVFLKMNPLFMGFGAIGAALGVAMKPKKVAVDIPVSDISSVSKDKFGPLGRTALAVNRANGEVVKFAVKDYDEWAEAVESARAAQGPGG